MQPKFLCFVHRCKTYIFVIDRHSAFSEKRLHKKNYFSSLNSKLKMAKHYFWYITQKWKLRKTWNYLELPLKHTILKFYLQLILYTRSKENLNSEKKKTVWTNFQTLNLCNPYIYKIYHLKFWYFISSYLEKTIF